MAAPAHVAGALCRHGVRGCVRCAGPSPQCRLRRGSSEGADVSRRREDKRTSQGRCRLSETRPVPVPLPSQKPAGKTQCWDDGYAMAVEDAKPWV